MVGDSGFGSLLLLVEACGAMSVVCSDSWQSVVDERSLQAANSSSQSSPVREKAAMASESQFSLSTRVMHLTHLHQ